MISGIYKFVFSNGSFYIGKSADIENRWKQHTREMQKGKHTKSVQKMYDAYGLPEFSILTECHEHHIDIMESYFINGYWGISNMLNTTKPKELSGEEVDLLANTSSEIWNASTFSHLASWGRCEQERDRALETIEDIKDGTKLREVEEELKIMTDRVIEKNREIYRLKHRGLWARIFNIY